MNSINTLTVDKAAKELLCEAFDLDNFASSHMLMRWISFASERTQTVATFMVMTMERDDEGEILAWHYRPSALTLKHCPELAGWKLVVLND